MAEAIFDEFGFAYEITLVPSRGGVFEVDLDGRPIHSKRDTGRHAQYETDVAPDLRG
jgi:selenoprotein W-related protein